MTLSVLPAPHIRHSDSITVTMADVLIALLPCVGTACYYFGWRIAVNCAKDAVRTAVRHPASSLSFAGEEDEDGITEWDIPVTSGDTVPEDAVEKRELILAVRRAVESLPEEQRQVIVMRDLHGLPYQDSSAALGIGLGTVKSRLSRGRQNLKIILD